MEKTNPQGRSQKIEVFLSGLGAAVCLLITYLIWSSLAPNQDMWLLPGGYFLEWIVGSALCFWVYFLRNPKAATLSTIYSGALVVFIVLAGFTVGFLYIPVFLIFGGLSIFSVFRHKLGLVKHMGIFVISGLGQLALMLFFIRLLR